ISRSTTFPSTRSIRWTWRIRTAIPNTRARFCWTPMPVPMAYAATRYALDGYWILDKENRRNFAPVINKPVVDLFSLLNPWVSFEDCSMAHIHVLEKAAEGVLPLFAKYYCHADDTNASEPTMDILKKFRPDLLLRLKSALPGYTPFMSNQKLKDHT